MDAGYMNSTNQFALVVNRADSKPSRKIGIRKTSPTSARIPMIANRSTVNGAMTHGLWRIFRIRWAQLSERLSMGRAM